MSTEEPPSDKFSFNDADLEELEILLEAEADEQLSTVQIFSVSSPPILSPLPMPPLPFFRRLLNSPSKAMSMSPPILEGVRH